MPCHVLGEPKLWRFAFLYRLPVLCPHDTLIALEVVKELPCNPVLLTYVTVPRQEDVVAFRRLLWWGSILVRLYGLLDAPLKQRTEHVEYGFKGRTAPSVRHHHDYWYF